MSNWAQKYSNEEKVVFEKGNWKVTEDGEKVWSLYFNGECVDPVSDYNKFKLFEKGFLLFYEGYSSSSYALFEESLKNPIFTLSGKNISVETEKNLITFTNNENSTSFDTSTMIKVHLNEEDQIGLEF